MQGIILKNHNGSARNMDLCVGRICVMQFIAQFTHVSIHPGASHIRHKDFRPFIRLNFVTHAQATPPEF